MALVKGTKKPTNTRILAPLTMAPLTMAPLTMAPLTMALLTMAPLTMALLTMALLTMAKLWSYLLCGLRDVGGVAVVVVRL